MTLSKPLRSVLIAVVIIAISIAHYTTDPARIWWHVAYQDLCYGPIFDPFFSTKKRGTGLGLSISNRIVQSHGGRIEVQQPAHGTVIRVLVPLGTAAVETRSQRRAKATT